VATAESKVEPLGKAPVGDSSAGPEAAARALHLNLRDKDPEQVVPELVEYTAKLQASDLFFNTDEDCVEVAARHLGLLRSIGTLSLDTGRRCISYIKTLADMDISEHRRAQDGRWLFKRPSGRRLDLRINTIPTLYGEDCTVRVLGQEERLLALDQLGLSNDLYNYLVGLLKSPSGLLLVTGPMETGKSTTLYACLSHLNNGERKVNTIEDPIEYSVKGLRQSQVNTKVGLTFDELLRGVLRQALHAPVASAAVHSLLRMGVHPHLLSGCLLGILSQRLLRTLCPRCKVALERPSDRVFEEVKPWLAPGEGEYLFAAQGCPECHMTGYSGLTAIFEMLKITPEIRKLTDEAAPVSVLRQKSIEQGLTEFRLSALLKVARGETTAEEVVRVLPAEYLT
jgi:type II secretory ATPase GspE/PulE/Tfp pilus assembly ATPase PilB-like protein